MSSDAGLIAAKILSTPKYLMPINFFVGQDR